MTARWTDHEWYCFAHQSGHCSCRSARPAAVVKSAEGAAAGTHVPGASEAMKQMALDAHARAVAPADCTDPQPIAVSHGSERHQVFCGSCRWRGPIVGDRRSASQGFDADHGSAL